MMRTDRRGFLKASTAAAGAVVMDQVVSGADPSRPLQMGVIGVGWYGMVDALAALKVGGVRVAAVCDVDSEHLKNAADELEKKQASRPETFKHYQELLDVESLDVVVIATPPHWHALQLLAAIERKKDVYCEKPVAYDVREGQAMVEAVNASDRIVQVGFQRRQSAALRQAAEFIASGGIGKLVQVDAQIHYHAALLDPTPQAPPESLDWELWCGPGPRIPYSPQVGHKSWRLEKTSGHGHLVDWGIHLIDAIRTMLGLGMPKQVTAAGGIYHYAGGITTPDTLSAHFEFEGLPVHWRHRLWGSTEYEPALSNGIFFFGTEGTVFAADRTWTVIRRGKEGAREEHDAPADLGRLHMADFLDAVRTRRKPSCTIGDGFQSTATVQLAMIALETGSTVRWDAKTLQVLDNPAAAALLRREYRPDWVHPFG
ncbi:MAG: Gfo/Idh/MocA family oxidoreductase [Planctomycetes bacterium]|nr:Gfo/Idh/MocA family oxidoreductase [Planctomycetota bacterium]